MVSRERISSTRYRLTATIKRTFDFVVSATMLVFLAPVMGLVVILIRTDSQGPAFFTQRRIGRDGAPFTVFKFRTMYNGSSETIHQQVALNWFEERRSGPRYKSDADPRVTRVGRYLRRTSLDELPQLWNVVRGDMSLVGPRPLTEYERLRFNGWHFDRELVRPGITGLWQVSGRDRLSAQQMLALDVRYVQSCSFWLDLKILARTLPAVWDDVRRQSAPSESRPSADLS
jgi:lipopolysaccharide/colanic/teichoic acid biosynthesis glycosyltransferase